jgi:hypothetical protein
MVMIHFRSFFLVFFVLFFNCKKDFGDLQLVTELHPKLKEVSGIALDVEENVFWMINDRGNASKIYKVSQKGELLKTLNIKGKNKDWEDLTFDEEKNLYVGDFGNNENDRVRLRILKIAHQDLGSKKKVSPKKISFYYPEQKKFPPKDKKKFYDAEAFFYFNKHFYIFTKSQVDKKYGNTNLYRIPARTGNHEAKFIATYKGCEQEDCAITAAAISKDYRKVALLSSGNILVFSNFKGDNFFSGKVSITKMKYSSQKEAICFKDKNTLFIADETAFGEGGNLYELTID